MAARNIQRFLTALSVAEWAGAASLDRVSGAALIAGDGVPPSRRRDAEYEGEPAPGRLLLRFAIGVAELGEEGLAAALRRFEAARVATAPAEPPAPSSGRHVLLGALCAAPDWLSRKLHPHPTLVPRARPASQLARRTPGIARAHRYVEQLGARARAQLGRWAETGTREEQAGRDLARLAVGVMFEDAMTRIAQSPELKHVIEEQSEGLTSSAMSDLRESSARADQVVESVARRLLRRRPT
jgi:hypothetical protein